MEIKAFAEERGITVRYLKRIYSDIIYREGRKLSIDAEAYDRLMPERSSSNRKKSLFSGKTRLKREIKKVEKYDHFITASGQEVEFLTEQKEQILDPHRVAILELEIEELKNSIAEKELLKRRAEMEITRLMPRSLKIVSKEAKESDEE